MTVPTTAAFTGPYYPNGVTTEYPFGFKVNSDSEVAVFFLEDDGSETIIPSANYTVTLSSNDNMPGGTVTTAGPLPVDARPLYIGLDPEFIQTTKFEDEGAFNQSILNPTFDAGALRSIWLRARVQRSLLVPFGEAGLNLPRASERAGLYPVFGPAGELLLSSGTGSDPALRADLAAAGGAGLLTVLQSGVGAVATTLLERLRREVWAEDFMVKPVVGDQTAAFQAAIDSLPAGGGTVRFRGDYIVGTADAIRFPAEPKVVYLLGEGRSILRQGAANAPMIAKVAGVSRVVGAHIKGFTVVAHEDSLKATVTNILVNIAGFDWSQLDLEYQGNAVFTATKGRAHAVIAGHANNGPCYNNQIRLKMAQTAGPAKGVWLHNGGGSSLNNANVNMVSGWTYALDACDVAIDAADSTQTVIHDGLFEDCPGMTGVLAGNFTVTRNNWFELVDVAINYGNTADTAANNCISMQDQFSGANTIVIHSTIAGPPRFEAPLFGAMTFENEAAAASTNYITPTLARVQPAIPAVSWLIIGAGTVADATSIRTRVDHHGITTTMATYTATPLGVGRDALSITPPAGFEIMNATVGIEEIGVGVRPVALSADPAGKNYVVYWPNTNSHQVNVRVTMRAI